MNPEIELHELQEILRNILSGIQDTIQSGEVLSDEFQGQIAQLLNQATERMTDLYQEIQGQQELQEAEQEQSQVAEEVEPPSQPPSTTTGGNIPPLEPAPHESSNINAFRYDPISKKLFVKFQGKYPLQNGPVYSYDNVPSNIYDVFRRGAVVPKTSGKNAWHTWKEGVAPSHGASMYALIKQGGYNYHRLN